MSEYPELQNAPADHHSEEFLEYLRENNEVIEENDDWLLIANCKYDRPDRRWYTLFAKGEMLNFKALKAIWIQYRDWAWLKKPASEQSVKRFHIHIYKDNN